MNGATLRRAVIASCILALTLVFVPVPAHAQSGSIRGKITDAQDQPVDGATISLSSTDKGGKPINVKTNKRGEYMQVGLSPGHYKVTVTKGDLTVTKETDVHLDMLNFDVRLVAGGGGGAGGGSAAANKEEAAKNEKIKATFAEGVQLSKDGKNDEAIAKFQEVAALVPTCAECYLNIGTIQMNGKKYDDAIASFNKSIEIKPTPEAYDSLANVYNTQKKFPEAEAAGKKAMELSSAGAGAAGGASASALYNQAVILWNQNKAQDAADKLEQATKTDPAFPEAHYLLGKAYINLGKLPESAKELQEYLRLSPNGANHDDATKTLEMLKPYIK
ncbi:MAG TPA: tetratricopeptide repeat protein [Vicinamibacterales bacterium]|jgi:tetratricopeptide (TPR) repeat protein